MAEGAASAPAGWYADPEVAGGKRYWDGERWTDQRRPATPTVSKESARKEYADLLTQIATGGIDGKTAAPRLSELEGAASYKAKDLAKLRGQAFQRFADDVLADAVVTEEEERRFADVVDALGFTEQELDEHKHILIRLEIATLNAGRGLPEIPNPRIRPKQGEVVHLEVGANLLKEVTVKQQKHGSGGLGVPLGFGVRYYTPRRPSRTVAAGTRLQTEDSGTLCVTSNRVVFTGGGNTIEIPYSRLVNMDAFDDGTRFHLSGRKSALLFQFHAGDGHRVAGYVNAASSEPSEKGTLPKHPAESDFPDALPGPLRMTLPAWQRHRERLEARLEQESDASERYRDLILITNVMAWQIEDVEDQVDELRGRLISSRGDPEARAFTAWVQPWAHEFQAVFDRHKTERDRLRATLSAAQQQAVEAEVHREAEAIKEEFKAALQKEASRTLDRVAASVSDLSQHADASAAETKVCPDCAEEVRAAARKCRYCGYRFDAETAP